MNIKSKHSLSAYALFALLAIAPISNAQPIRKANPQFSVAVVIGTDNKPLITLRASQTSASAILSLLAVKTGAKIFVKSDAIIDSLELKRVPLPDAIEQIAKAANLKLVKPIITELDNAYTVGEIESRPNAKTPNSTLDLEFKDIAVSQLVKTLKYSFKVKASVDPSVPEKNIDIVAFNVSAVEALQIIADTADLDIIKTADGYILCERVYKKFNLTLRDMPTSQLFRAFSEQFGVKIQLAPDLPDKTIDIDLSNMTPEEALKATAKTAGFEVSEVDGVYTVREHAATAK